MGYIYNNNSKKCFYHKRITIIVPTYAKIYTLKNSLKKLVNYARVLTSVRGAKFVILIREPFGTSLGLKLVSFI